MTLSTVQPIMVYQTIISLVNDELARRNFRDFVLAMMPDFEIAPHHELLFDLCQQLIDGQNLRECVSLPPRHSKSQLFSVFLPLMYLGRYPNRQVLHVSHTSHLSNEFSRQVRELMRDSMTFRRLFPHVKLHPDKARVDDWKTIQGGGFKSVGVEGAITGTGFHLAILDDVVKEGDESSPVALDGHFNWYVSALRTRAAPGASIVIPMTRWSIRDIIGRLQSSMLESPDAEQWNFLSLPALAEQNDSLGRAPGEALWAARFPRRWLLSIKALSSYYFDALYQQHPRTSEMEMFRQELFRRVPRYVLPRDYTKVFWAFDLAISESDRADYTAIGRCHYYEPGVLADNPVIILSNIHRYRRAWGRIERLILRMIRLFPDDEFVFPNQTYELMALQSLSARASTDKLVQVAMSEGQKDKVRRAQLAQSLHERGGIWVAAGRNNNMLIQEAIEFPDSAHDDLVDMMTTCCYHLGIGGEFLALVGKLQSDTKPDFYKQLEQYGISYVGEGT